MKLQMFKRTSLKKSETNRIRREGYIPAVIYTHGENTEALSVKSAEFNALVRSLQPGRLPTTIFILTDEQGKERRAILKEVQYAPTSYAVQHLDFEELFDDTKINVKVPIECVGVVDCVGVKLGGVIRQVIRHLRVRCLPKDIPQVFPIDVKSMELKDCKRLRDLEIPETVRPLVNLNEVAVVIAKR